MFSQQFGLSKLPGAKQLPRGRPSARRALGSCCLFSLILVVGTWRGRFIQRYQSRGPAQEFRQRFEGRGGTVVGGRQTFRFFGRSAHTGDLSFL